MQRWACALCLSLTIPCLGARALGDEDAASRHAPLPGNDGVYGRMDGSMAWAAALGAELEDGEPRASLRASAHYLWVAGGYLRYAEGFGSGSARPLRALSLGADLRPLFLPRFARDLEQGPALLDLTLDSLSLTAGAYFAQPRSGSFGEERGFELGLGLGVPLLAQAAGPWLQLRAERRIADEGDDAWLFSLLLGIEGFSLSTDVGTTQSDR
ncbi:MAG TPA: hypothetical protein VIW29_19480 [Polyangiaceae bacterium]